MISVFIPSRNERFLNDTIRSVLDNALGKIEVFPILDGYSFPPIPEEVCIIKDPRVQYLRLPKVKGLQKRQGVNAAASIAQGEHFMCLDAHCMVGPGFDQVLSSDCEKNWVMIPRRYKLDPINWKIKDDGSPPVDYEYWLYREYLRGFLKPYKWNDRTLARKDILIDDTMTCQASCWFMHRDWFKQRGFMQVDGYTGWGQEDVEISMETWTNGGRLVTNKKTWYAHLYKGQTFGRGYRVDTRQWDASQAYGHRHWTVERRKDFLELLQKFSPIPNWELNGTQHHNSELATAQVR
jgi:hypothetical protein